MELDIEETPILDELKINGLLKFATNKNINLRSKFIYIMAGFLHVGEKGRPYQMQG
jgi:hypothetical protein